MHWLQVLSLLCGIVGVYMILVYLDAFLEAHPRIDRWLDRFIEKIEG